MISVFTSCIHRQEARPVSAEFILDKISKEAGLRNDLTIIGSFEIQTESFNYAGHFILNKNVQGIKLRIYGPFGMKTQDLSITPEVIKDTILLYILGYYPQINGVIYQRGTDYFIPGDKITLKTDNHGNVLLVSFKRIKIFLNNYRKIKDYKMPEKIIVRKGTETLRIKISKVEFGS